MYAANWGEVKDILSRALELEPGSRKQFVENADVDAVTRNELFSLLSAEMDSVDFLSAPAASLLGGMFDKDDDDLTAGSNIGPYWMVRELGTGGMGTVYLAERADGKFSQQVAVKLVRRELNARLVRAAFAREIEILSRLVHPNIARLLDTGSTADGIPYLVMEYVEGESIDRYCRHNNCSLTQTLKLFNRVCEAVAFSHQNLIIHRDIKPSNIIVTANGTPKLLDFGISKLLDESGSEATGLTLPGAMTPEYASPEQINGAIVTTATDVYSLGAVLYKLLTGEAPGPLPDVSGAVTPPSRRNAGTARLPSSLLRGDLDNIVLRSLDHDPLKRYQTVQQLSEDIWRHIDGHPVRARRPTLRYRAAKVLGRYRVAAGAAVVVLFSLVLGTSIALWQAREARAHAAFASNEAERARTEQLRSEKISKFMFRVLSYGNPRWYAEGARQKGQARVIDVIRELGDDIDKEFANEPDIAAELHQRFCEIYGSSSEPDAAEFALAHIRRAYDLRRQYYGPEHELVAKDMFYLYISGGVPKEEMPAFLLDAIRMIRETNPDNLNFPYMIEDYVTRMLIPGYERYSDQYTAALPLNGETKYQWAERMLRESDRTFHVHYTDDNPAIAANRCRLAYVLLMQGRSDEAGPFENACREASSSGKIRPWYATTLDQAHSAMPQLP
jgi:tRNA A-37 threonylcarbamoyl transferase component Bud32